jgi:hypothetical protein
MSLPVDSVDLALFNAATRITIYSGNKASFGIPAGLMDRHLQNYSHYSTTTVEGSKER